VNSHSDSDSILMFYLMLECFSLMFECLSLFQTFSIANVDIFVVIR